MIDYFWSLGAWSWLVAAILLLALEMVVPGVHFVWFGLAAGLTAIVSYATGMPWPWQLVAFVVMSGVTVLIVRKFARYGASTTDEPALNERGVQYVGRTVLIEVPIEGGRGKVRVGDTLWQASGPNLPKGAHARVTGCDGTVLKVEAT